MNFFYLIFLLLLFGWLYPRVSDEDSLFLQKFTEQKQNLQHLKLPDLRRLFKLLALNPEKAKKLYDYCKKQNPKNLDEINKIGFDQKEISLLKKYLFVNPDALILDFIDSEDSQLLDYYRDFLVRPVSLNNANITELMELPHMSLSKAKSILQARRRSEITTIDSLTNFGWTPVELKWLRPFVSLRPRESNSFSAKTSFLYQEKFQDVNYLLQNDFSEERNFQIRASLDTQAFRLFIATRNSDLPFLTDSWSNSLSNGNFHLLFPSKPLTIFIGNFELRSGQGILFGNPMIFPPSDLQSPPFYHKDRGIKASSSLSFDLNQDGIRDNFSGTALSFQPNLRFRNLSLKLRFDPFLSFSSNFQINASGFNVAFLNQENSLGFNFLNTPAQKAFSLYHDIFPFENLRFYGEEAWNSDQQWALLQGIKVKSSHWKSSLALYFLSSLFESPYGSPFLHGQNKGGGLFGVEFKDFSNRFFSALDVYDFSSDFSFKKKLSLRYQKNILLKSKLPKKLQFSFKSKYTDDLDTQDLRNTLGCRLIFNPKINLLFKYQNTILFQNFSIGQRLVFLYAQSFSSFVLKNELSFYDSPSSLTRLYDTELQTSPSEFSIVSYNGKGINTGILIQWKLSPSLKIHSRYLFGYNENEDKKTFTHKISFYLESVLI